MSQLDFAALLCSRLCHDLVSPVGAISNGLEILGDTTDASLREQVVDLLNKSAKQTSNKLQFFRLAFGAAGGFSAELDYGEAKKALDAFLEGSRIELDWHVPPGSGNKSIVKLVLNMALIASETLIRGGTLSVTFGYVSTDKPGMPSSVTVMATGDRVIAQASVGQALEADLKEDDLEPRTAPVYLARQCAEELDYKLEFAVEEEGKFQLVAK